MACECLLKFALLKLLNEILANDCCIESNSIRLDLLGIVYVFDVFSYKVLVNLFGQRSTLFAADDSHSVHHSYCVF